MEEFTVEEIINFVMYECKISSIEFDEYLHKAWIKIASGNNNNFAKTVLMDDNLSWLERKAVLALAFINERLENKISSELELYHHLFSSVLEFEYALQQEIHKLNTWLGYDDFMSSIDKVKSGFQKACSMRITIYDAEEIACDFVHTFNEEIA